MDKIYVSLYASNINSYEFLSGKSLAMFLFKDSKNRIYLLRGTTISPYMSEQLYNDMKDAIEMGFSLDELVDLFDKSKSLKLLGTTLDTFQKHANDNWNWHKWSMTHNFTNRFWIYISEGRTIRKIA